MKIQESVSAKQVDIFELIMKFKKRYRNVFVHQIDEQIFIYRALGRKEYKDILTDSRFNDFEKEELICDTCLLYPDKNEIDWDTIDAGIPTELMKQVRKNSYLDDKKSRRNILDFYRAEMHDLDNQITCIINEAFPQIDIEEIEEWDVEKTMKYLTRAEWKLTNLRGLEFRDAQGDFYDGDATAEEITPETEELSVENEKTIRGGDKTNKLTPAKAAANKNAMSLEELKAKFPDVDWGNTDNGMQGIDGLAQDSVDITSPALRPGW